MPKRRPKRFDATTRSLYELGPVAWLRFLRVEVFDPALVSVIDSNLSTFTAEADKVIRVSGPRPWIELIEAQAGRDNQLDHRSHVYSTLLRWQHKVPVNTTLLLLRPAADGPELTGRLDFTHPDGTVYSTFRYNVIRLWQQPVESILAAGLPVLPLAPVARVTLEELPDVLVAMSDRLKQEATLAQASAFWSATRIMMGLRYPEEQIDAIMSGGPVMLYGMHGLEESSVIQGALKRGEAKGRVEGIAEGIAKEARNTLIRLASRKYGAPNKSIKARIRAIKDIDRLHDLTDRFSEFASWDELLASNVQ